MYSSMNIYLFYHTQVTCFYILIQSHSFPKLYDNFGILISIIINLTFIFNCQKQLVMIYYIRNTQAVQYNSDTNSWGGFVSDIYKAIKGRYAFNDEVTKFITTTKDWDFSDIKQKLAGNEEATDRWINRLELSGEDFKKFLKNWDGTGDIAESYQQYLKKAGQSTLTFTDFTQKAIPVLKSFSASMMSMGVNWLISEAIGAGVTVIDNYIHRVEKAQEALSSSVSTFEITKSDLQDINTELETQSQRIDELLAKDKLTYAEQSEFENLQKITKELELQKALKEEELKRNARDVADKAVKAYETQYNGPISNDAIGSYVNSYNKYGVVADSISNIYDLNGQIASYKILTEQRIEALKNQNENYQDFADKAQSVKDNLYTNLETLTKIRDSLTDIPLDELSEYQKDILKSVESDIKNLWSILDQNKWNQIQLDHIFDMDDLEVTKDKLIELSKAGKLDEETIRSYPELTKAISEMDLFIEKGITDTQAFIKWIQALGEESASIPDMDISPSFSASSMTETVKLLNEMAEKWKTVDELYAEFLEKGTGNFNNEALAGLAQAFEEINGIDINGFLSTLSDSASTADDVQEAFNRLATQYIYASGCLNGLTDATAEQIVKELEAQGVVNASAIVYNYLTGAKEYAAITGRDLANATAEEIVAFINETAISNEAKEAIAGYALQKELANGATIDTSGDITNLAALVGALGGVNSALKAYNTLKKGGDAGALKGAGGEGARAMYEAAQAELDNAMVNFEKKVNSTHFVGGAAANKVRSSAGSSGGSSGASKEKAEKEATKETINWIERKYEILQKEHDILQKIANDETVSYRERISSIDELIKRDKERMETAVASAKRYEEEWNKAIENLKPIDITNIMSGNIDITEYDESVYGEGYISQLKEAMDIYDKKVDMEQKATDIEEEMTDHLREEVKLQEEIIKAQQELIQGKMDIVNAHLDWLEASGGVVTAGIYKEQIALSKELSDSYEDQISNLNEQLDLVDSGSAEYYSILASINDCEEAIIKCRTQQEEWNEAIKRIPIDRLQKYVNLLRNIKTDLQNFLDEQSTLGINPTADQLQELINLSHEEINNLMEQQKHLSELLESYQYGSEKFDEVSGEIQDIDNEISSLIQNQREWNTQLLQIPITNLEKVNDNLSKYSDILGDTLSQYDDVHSTVLDLLDEEVDKINDVIDATNKEYEAKIKPLEEQLEILKDTNEERRIQLGLEQAEYDLERARNQKTNQVVREGELVWENDKAAERDALIKYQDAQYGKTVFDLEKQIETLEKERDALLEGYDQEIKRLNTIKDYWQDIIKDIERAGNALNANEVLGANWKDTILAGGKGNEELADYFKGLYEVTYTQKESADNQIESNERILDMMSELVERFNSGALTYEQALNGVNQLSSSMADGYSALEHLTGMMNLDGISDLSGIASSADAKITESVDLLRESLGAAQTNFDAINEVAKTWDEVKQNIAEQLETLKRLAEELAKKKETTIIYTDNYYGGGDDYYESDKNSRPDFSRDDYVAAGPGFDKDDMYDAIDDGRDITFEGMGAGGYSEDEIRDMYEDYAENITRRHRGAELGVVGKESDTRKDNLFQDIATKVLKPGEKMLIAHENEWVITPEQRDNLLNALGVNLPDITSSMPQIPSFMREQSQKNVDVHFGGDIVLQGVQDPDGFAKALKVQIAPIMRQELSKVR